MGVRKLMPVPLVGEEYDFFDDGKVKMTRHNRAYIQTVASFNTARKDLRELWKQEVDQCSGLYAKETDVLVYGHLDDEENTPLTFTRTVDGGWFSFGNPMGDGRLDVDGSLMKQLRKWEEKSG